jgi:hypothetical protein
VIVELEALKLALGVTGADEDDYLTQLEAQAARWVEERFERSFQAPAEKVVYLKGKGTSTLFLWGTVEDTTADAVVIRERAISGGAWEAIDEPEEVFEVRRTARVTKLERIDGSVWPRGMEYEVTFDDGYETAPADIQALVIDAVNQSRNALIAINDEGTVKSESIGDYSYTLDLSVAAGALSAGFTNTSGDTINRWRRVRA